MGFQSLFYWISYRRTGAGTPTQMTGSFNPCSIGLAIEGDYKSMNVAFAERFNPCSIGLAIEGWARP